MSNSQARLTEEEMLRAGLGLPDGFHAEVYAGKWEPLQAGCLPPDLPVTRDELLAYIQALRSRLTEAAAVASKLRGYSYAPDGFPALFADKAVFVQTKPDFGFVYLLPAIQPLWLATARFIVDRLPPFSVEPKTDPAAIQALDALAACLKPVPPSMEALVPPRLIFDAKGCSITLDDVTYKNLEYEAVVILKAIFDESPKRIKSPSIRAIAGLPEGTRIDRIKDKLPADLREIVSGTNAGYRIFLPVRSAANP